MSMNGNPHYESAKACYGAANSDADKSFNDQVRADAVIQATLALAYEQRTANLIAFLSEFGRDFTGVPPEVAQLWFKQVHTISERLGIKE